MNTIVIITIVIIAVVASSIWDFDFKFSFFFYQNGPLLVILNTQNLHQLPVIEMRSFYVLISEGKKR